MQNFKILSYLSLVISGGNFNSAQGSNNGKAEGLGAASVGAVAKDAPGAGYVYGDQGK